MRRNERIYIVEDELLIGEYIADILLESGFADTHTFTSAEAALAAIADVRPDVVLTDISLEGEMTGIDLGKILQTTHRIPFIYITSHSGMEMVKNAGLTSPNAYLVKPIKPSDLTVALQLALITLETSRSSEQEVLMIKDGYKQARIPHEDIICLEADKNYTLIHIRGVNRPKLVRYLMSEIQRMLPEEKFVRVHKSYVVNRKLITSLTANQVDLGEFKFPVGRAYRGNLINDQL